MASSNLLSRVLSHDETAIRDFIENYHLILKRVIIKYSGSQGYEDILQETWIKVFNNLHKFNQQSDIQTWMIRIAINVANTFHHKKSSQYQFQADDMDKILFDVKGHWKQPLINWPHTPEQQHERDQLQQVIDEEIMQLPENQKAVLMMHDIQGINFKNICNALEISESNVRVLLHRARQQVLLRVDMYYKECQC